MIEKDLKNLNKLKVYKKGTVSKKQIKKMSGFQLPICKKEVSKTEEIIDIIIENKSHKSQTDKIKLANFLSETDLIVKLKNEKINTNNLESLMYLCTTYLEFLTLHKGEILFKEGIKNINQGDIGDKFYIIISGSVNVLYSTYNNERLTGEQYINKLIKLKADNFYKELLEKTVRMNNKVFYVDLKQLEHIYDIIFCLKVTKILLISPNISKIDEIINESNININEYFVDYNHLNKYREDYFLIFKRQINYRLKELNIDLNDYRYLDSSEIRSVKIYYYEKKLSLNKGNYFGDVSLDTNRTRNSTIEGKDDITYLGFLRRASYMNYFGKEKKQLGLQELSFFLDNFFFQSIPKEIFKVKYFYDFVLIEMKKNEYIVQEKENLNYLYFCKEGEIEITLSMSLDELHNLIQTYSKKIGFEVPKITIDLSEGKFF